MKTFHVGGFSPLRRYKTLEAALAEAKDDDTIELHKNLTFSGKVPHNIILNGNGHTLTVENGRVGLDCEAPIVITNLTIISEPRANGLVLQKGGRLDQVTTKIKGPARVLFPTILHKAGTLTLTKCNLMRVSTDTNGKVNATECTFTDYYGGYCHLPNLENVSRFQGTVTMQQCDISCCAFNGRTNLRESILRVFNHNNGDLCMTNCQMLPTVNAPVVNLKKEPVDGPLEYRNEQSKFVLEQNNGSTIVYGYESIIPEDFVGFHILRGTLELHHVNNLDATGYHIVRNASLSFVDVMDAAFYETNGATLSMVRSQVQTSTKTETAMDKLNKLVGLTEVKETLQTILNTISVNQKSGNKDFGFSYHMVFAGDPGTGKTTVAKLTAQALFEIGAIPENKCTEVSVDRLVKGYVGQTAEHVRQVLDDALGGVLFIDEAYELSVKDGQNSFNSEVLSVLIRYMEEHREELVVIAAGYEREMKEFLASNVGLTRRFQWVFFEDYTPQEMADIFQLMLQSYKESFESDTLKGLLPQLFTKLTGIYQMKPDSRGRITNGGNGGLVRNVFQQVLQVRNNRLAEQANHHTSITKDDLIGGFRKEMEKAVKL